MAFYGLFGPEGKPPGRRLVCDAWGPADHKEEPGSWGTRDAYIHTYICLTLVYIYMHISMFVYISAEISGRQNDRLLG